MTNKNDTITVICHRADIKGEQPSVGYIQTEAKSFKPDTPISEIIEWATGDQTQNEIERLFRSKRNGLFRIELSIPEEISTEDPVN